MSAVYRVWRRTTWQFHRRCTGRQPHRRWQITINWASGRTWHHNLGWTLLGGGLAGSTGSGLRWWRDTRVLQAPMAFLPAPSVRGRLNSVGIQGPFSVTPEGTATAFRDLPRRPGLPLRVDGGWEKGQLTDAEFNFLRGKAQQFQKQIVLAGSLNETDLGLQRRYDPQVWPKLPPFRRDKPRSGLVDYGTGDVDFWEGSGLSSSELNEIWTAFPSFDVPDMGYTLEYYPTLDVFAQKGGALIFEPDGTTWRIPGIWQRHDWEL